MKKLRTVAVLPTMFTLGNLLCGFFAIVVASRVGAGTLDRIPPAPQIEISNPAKVFGAFDPTNPTHNIVFSAWLIFVAMIFDALDGHVARLVKITSDFGAQLDSLCDLVTFGVAPAFLMVKMCPDFTFFYHDEMWIIAAAFVACAAMRLARFNAETEQEDDHLSFIGLPTPAAAGSIASFAILFYTLRLESNHLPYAQDIDWYMRRFLPLFTLMLSALMVSRIPYPHVVNQLLNGQRSLGHIVALLFSLVVIIAIRGYSVPIICSIFVLGPPLRYAWQRWRNRAQEQESESLF
ncbi:MAG TPA: CDP-diacylglycerol--serine O-phosphatidyltransferase [Pirellulales bacterium]|jgi:CDP-diacylglycerol--serine O-phosphatidyltransferase|nr:CDP-diacylglycerol--serine O-phosphatidyltransferase [Pirellulales bacterium]